MTNDARELFDRVDAEQADEASKEEAKLRRQARRRRTRRERRPARLRFVSAPGGGTLFVPAPWWARLHGIVMAAGLTGNSYSFAHDMLTRARPFLPVDYVWLVLLLGMGPLSCYLALSMFGTKRIELLAGRGYVVRERTILGFLKVLTAGDDPEVKLSCEHSGLTKGHVADQRLPDLGDADVEVLKEACLRAKFPIQLPTAEERERADRWQGRGIERHVLLSIAAQFGIVLGFLALFYFTEQSVLDEYAAPELPVDAELAGLFRSRGAESWGEWSIQPSRITAGGGDGTAGVTVTFPEGSPVRELRVKASDEEHDIESSFEWYFVGEDAPRIIRTGEWCRKFKLHSYPCKNADGTWDAQDRTKAKLRFECWTQGLDGTLISNCPKPTP